MQRMDKLFSLLEKAKTSGFYRQVLNFSLARAIPFNKPHHFKILEVYEDGLKILLPCRRSNLNHLKSIHACALATLCEYTAGSTLLTSIQSNAYRFIMKDLTMTYHFQAKMDVTVEGHFSKKELAEKITVPLQSSDAVFVRMTMEVFDLEKNHICTGTVNWQIKKWEKVKTKISA